MVGKTSKITCDLCGTSYAPAVALHACDTPIFNPPREEVDKEVERLEKLWCRSNNSHGISWCFRDAYERGFISGVRSELARKKQGEGE